MRATTMPDQPTINSTRAYESDASLVNLADAPMMTSSSMPRPMGSNRRRRDGSSKTTNSQSAIEPVTYVTPRVPNAGLWIWFQLCGGVSGRDRGCAFSCGALRPPNTTFHYEARRPDHELVGMKE